MHLGVYDRLPIPITEDLKTRNEPGVPYEIHGVEWRLPPDLMPDCLHCTGLVVPLVLNVEMLYQPAYWVHALLWLPLTLALALLLIQPVKGAVVALQWHNGMHGFEEAKRLRDQAASG